MTISSYPESLKTYFMEVARGNVPGQSVVNKFGRNEEIDSANDADVWDAGKVGAGYAQYTYTFSSAAAAYYISSSNNGDTQDYEVQGLDANWDLQTITQTAVGQTKTRIGTTETYLRSFRVKNVGTTDNAGDVYIYEDSTVTAGVPDTLTNVRAMISAGFNQTMMAIYTIPAGKTGYVTNYYASANKATTTGAINTLFLVRPSGGVFQVKHVLGAQAAGRSGFQHFVLPPVPFTEKSDIKIRASSSTNDMDVSAGFDIILIDN